MSDAETDKPQKPEFNLGGQALVEGVMMRSPHFIGAAVRRADGSIETRVEEFQSVTAKHRWMRVPFFRGVFALVEMMSVGMRFLNWSAQVAMQNETPGAAEAQTESAAAAQGFVGIGAAEIAPQSEAKTPDNIA